MKRLNELSSLLRFRRRTKVEILCRRIIRLVLVFFFFFFQTNLTDAGKKFARARFTRIMRLKKNSQSLVYSVCV